MEKSTDISLMNILIHQLRFFISSSKTNLLNTVILETKKQP
jgi:hypothetical protein